MAASGSAAEYLPESPDESDSPELRPGLTVPTTSPRTISNSLPAEEQEEPLVGRLYQNDLGLSSESEDEHEQIILDPDHPLMVRFQEGLKQQLMTRYEELESELHQMKKKCCEVKKVREEIGVHLYEKQQELAHIRCQLEEISDILQTHTAQRLLRESDMTNIRKLYKTIFSDSNNARNLVSQQQKQLDDINFKVFCLLRGHDDVKNDVKVMRRAASKTRIDLAEQEEEKQRQDYRLNLLTELVEKKTTEIDLINAQAKAQIQEKQEYQFYLSEADIELEVLQTDIKQVKQNWKSTLLGMSHSDQVYATMLGKYSDEENILLCKDKEIEAYRKNILKAEQNNEKLMYVLQRSSNDIYTTKRFMLRCHKKMEDLHLLYSSRKRMLASMEDSLNKTVTVKKKHEEEKLNIRRQFEFAVQARNDLKLQLLEVLQTQASFNKAVEFAEKKTLSITRRNIQLETEMSKEESDIAIIEQQLEVSKARMGVMVKELDQVRDEIDEKNKVVSTNEQSVAQNLVVIERKQNHMAECNKKLASLLEKREGNEVSPLENLVLNLMRSLHKESNNMLEDQTMWLEKQHECLDMIQSLKDQRMKIKKKSQEIKILNGKKSKLVGALKKQTLEKKKLELDISHLRLEMENVACMVWEKQGYKEELEKSGYLAETDFIRELKDMQLSVATSQRKLDRINEEKEDLLNQIVQLERQIGLWEKKIQLGVEMKETLDPKNNQNLDISTMKSEIHRMTLRHQALLREQEKLIRCMESAVTRRGYIVSGHKAVTQRNPDLLTRSKCKRQVTEARRQIFKVKERIVDVDDERRKFECDRKSLGCELDKKRDSVLEIKKKISEYETSIKIASAQKYRNLCELVMKQKKTVFYANVKEKKYKFLCDDPQSISSEVERERKKMEKILAILFQLKESKPEISHQLEQISSVYGPVLDT